MLEQYGGQSWCTLVYRAQRSRKQLAAMFVMQHRSRQFLPARWTIRVSITLSMTQTRAEEVMTVSSNDASSRGIERTANDPRDPFIILSPPPKGARVYLGKKNMWQGRTLICSCASVENTESTFVFLNVFAGNRKPAPVWLAGER